jgi:hypothetical protein
MGKCQYPEHKDYKNAKYAFKSNSRKVACAREAASITLFKTSNTLRRFSITIDMGK